MERDNRFQSFLSHISGDPNKQGLPIKQNYTILSKFHGTGVPHSLAPNGTPMERNVPFQSQWFVHSFLSLRAPS